MALAIKNPRPPVLRRASSRRTKTRGLALHGTLILGVAVSLFPLYWLFVMATNTTEAIYASPPTLTVGKELLTNIGHVLENVNFFASMANTVVVAVSTTLLVLFFDSLAAFTFAKFEFPGRNLLFGGLITTLLLPGQLSVIPQFLIMINLGWVGDLRALVIPAAANAFGIFWLRQYMQSAIPDELLETAKLDGCNFFRQYLTVCLPLIRPALGFLGMFTFIAAWNDYLWPLIVLTNPDKLTLQVALSQLNTAHGKDYGMLMAGALMAVVPLLVVFLFGAKQFVSDAVKGAVKG